MCNIGVYPNYESLYERGDSICIHIEHVFKRGLTIGYIQYVYERGKGICLIVEYRFERGVCMSVVY